MIFEFHPFYLKTSERYCIIGPYGSISQLTISLKIDVTQIEPFEESHKSGCLEQLRENKTW